MRQRPELAIWLGSFHLAVAAVVIAQVLFLAGPALWDHPQDIGLYFNSLNLSVIFISILTGVAAFNLSQALWFLLPLGLGLMTINNYVSGQAALQFDLWQTTVSTLVFAVAHLGYLYPDVRRILLRPELRWWSVPTRVLFEAPVFLEGADGLKVRARSFDISKTGLFVHVGLDQIAKIERPGEPLSLKLTHGRFQVMKLSIDLVRMTRGSGRYPEGVGLMFKNLKSDQRDFLNGLLSSVTN
jgi:hypothetical protein